MATESGTSPAIRINVSQRTALSARAVEVALVRIMATAPMRPATAGGTTPDASRAMVPASTPAAQPASGPGAAWTGTTVSPTGLR